MASEKKADEDKKAAALAAVGEVKGGMRVGLGSGSTTKYFIEELGKRKYPGPVIASSLESENIAKKAGLKVTTLEDMIAKAGPQIGETGILDLYVDGADESDKSYNLIKGGGGALTREKILASASNEFICIVDESKIVPKLGRFPLPVEVVPFAQSFVTYELTELGGQVKKREKFLTDNGNIILDVTGLKIKDPLELETELNNIPGVVENGIFSVRQADRLIVGRNGKAQYM
jgi:ribose 5-phosphate isomerase A